MADGNQLPSVAGHKRGRSGDFPEPIQTNPKKQRNDVNENNRNILMENAMIAGFTKLINDKYKATRYVHLFAVLRSRGKARQPIPIDPFACSPDLIEIDQMNTLILFTILNGLVPGFTIRTGEEEIRTWMTRAQLHQVQNYLIAIFPWVEDQLAQDRRTREIQLPPPPFQVLGVNAGNTSNNGSLQQQHPQQQEGFMGPGVHPQGLSNGARGFNTGHGVQPLGHPAQFLNTQTNSFPTPSQQPQETRPMQHLTPQVHQQQPRDFLHLFSPQEREEQVRAQLQMQRQQQEQQRQRVPLIPSTTPSRSQSRVGTRLNEQSSLPETSTAGHYTQLPRQDDYPEQRPTPPSQPSKAVPQKAEGRPKRRGRAQPVARIGNGETSSRILGPRSRQRPLVVTQPQRTQSDSAVPHNQNLGQHQHIQNISQSSQLASGQLGLGTNATGSQVDNHAGISSGASFAGTINPSAVPPSAVDRFMHGMAPDSIQRSRTVSGYPAQPTSLGLEIPPLVHSASTSPISPIAVPSVTLPSTGNTPPFGTGLNGVSADPGASSNERGWIHYPEGSKQQPRAQDQAANRPAMNFTFMTVDPSQGNKIPPRNKGSSRPRAQRLSGPSDSGRRSVQGGAADSSNPQSVQPSVRKQEKEEEEEEEEPQESNDAQLAAPGNGVYDFSIPFRLQQSQAQAQQPVSGGFAAGLPQQHGFVQYATQPASLLPPPQQQPHIQFQQPLNGATTPITPLPATTAIPSSVAQTQQQPQAGTSFGSAAPASGSTSAFPGPVVALDSGPNFSFGSLGLATGGEVGTSIDASQPHAEGLDGPIDSAFSEFDDLFNPQPYTHYDAGAFGFNSEEF